MDKFNPSACSISAINIPNATNTSDWNRPFLVVTNRENYLNIDWMYKGLEEYGYITGRSLLIKGISLVALFLFVKTRHDYVAYALISSLATGGNYIFNVIHAKKFVRLDFSGIKIQKHIKPVLLIACIIFLSSIYNKIDVTMLNMMATDESVGFYSYAQKTINMVLTMANAVTAALIHRLDIEISFTTHFFGKIQYVGIK